MELIKGYLKTIKVPVPATSTALSASITMADSALVVSADVPVEFENGIAEILIPYEAVSVERHLTLHLSFTIEGNTYVKKVALTVVTPYLELFELEEILESNNEEEAWKIEAAVRHIINAHCGQEFGVTEEPQKVIGDYDNTIGILRPVIRIDKITEDGVALYDRSVDQGAGRFLGMNDYIATGDGWFIKRPSYNVNSIRSDTSPYYSANPIRPPRYSDNSFVNDAEYIVSGRFGYEEVPPEVREAVKLLVNDYACQDSLYRDRYLKNIRAGDWRIEFAAGAWNATGNARADHLLAPYVVNRIVVI